MNMKKLDSAQRKYVEKRLVELVEQKTEASRKRFTDEGHRLTGEERLSALRAGKFQVKKGITSISNYADVVDVLQFNEEKPEKIDNEKHLKEVIKIKREASSIMDELMLIDADVALEKLRTFEAAK